MSTTKCPSCGSTDINFETRTCRNCGDSIDAAPQAESAPRLRLIEQASDAMEHARTESEREAAYEKWEEAVFDYYDDGFRIITLIGFSEAGKTFIAHRLRYELADDWEVWRPHASVIPRTGVTIELTQLVSREKPPRQRVLADCDGEAFKAITAAALENRDIDANMRRSIVISALASAYMLIMPAAELINRKTHSRTNVLVERFGTIVQLIMALQSVVKTEGNARKALQKGLRLDTVARALRHEFRCEQPIHVVFAKADNVPKDQRDQDDPHVFALTHARPLYRTVESNFTNFRFDFATAFEGYQDNVSSEVDYELPSYGTVAAFNWIDAMIDADPRDRKRTAAAMKIRRLFDPAFRKLAARISG